LVVGQLFVKDVLHGFASKVFRPLYFV